MNASHRTVGHAENEVGKSKKQVIALRISNRELYEKINKLANEQDISLNLAVNMLLGYAFNEAERQNKAFVKKVLFETK